MVKSTDSIEMLVQGVDRIALVRVEQNTPYAKGAVRPFPLPEDSGTEVEALQSEVIESARKLLLLSNPEAAAQFNQFIAQATNPLHLAYLVASVMSLEAAKEQALLEVTTRVEALRMVYTWLAHEGQVLEMRKQITSKAQTEIGKEQRDFLLRRAAQGYPG